MLHDLWCPLKMMPSRNGNLYKIHNVRHKNIKAKSGDGLSDSKPRWKYYTIMSFLDVTLLKRRYAAILLEFTYIHSYILFL